MTAPTTLDLMWAIRNFVLPDRFPVDKAVL